MKKKGFTLIELLAVIIILAVIALIATLIVLDVVESAKKSAFESTANGVAKVDSSGRIAIAVHNGDWCATKGYTDGTVTVTEYIDGVCTITEAPEEDILDNSWPIEWNSLEVTNNKIKVFDSEDEDGVVFVKISDCTPSLEDLNMLSLNMTTDDQTLTFASLGAGSIDIGAAAYYEESNYVQYLISVTTVGVSSEFGLTFPETGLYVLDWFALGNDIEVDFELKDNYKVYQTSILTDDSVTYTLVLGDSYVLQKVSDDILSYDELLSGTFTPGVGQISGSDYSNFVHSVDGGVVFALIVPFVFSVSDTEKFVENSSDWISPALTEPLPETGLYILASTADKEEMFTLRIPK